jgi:8-oxo-dGTP pyrophosphatase MutT (NUDIX family)
MRFFRNWGGDRNGPCIVRQSGALPYRIVNTRVVFLLVTSRRTGRWIFPKGAVSSGMTPWESAAKEALEEAGVAGQIDTSPIGAYRHLDGGRPIDIDLYPLRVEQQLDEWDEMHQRLRHWALLPEVRRLIADRSVSSLAASLERGLRSTPVNRQPRIK